MMHMAQIFYLRFDSDRINAGGSWNTTYGQTVLGVQHPLESQGQKSKDGLNAVITYAPEAIQHMGSIDAGTAEHAFMLMQEGNQLHARSMSIGDMVMIGNDIFICEYRGFSKLNEDQASFVKSRMQSPLDLKFQLCQRRAMHAKHVRKMKQMYPGLF